jgi:hypothetical protein
MFPSASNNQVCIIHVHKKAKTRSKQSTQEDARTFTQARRQLASQGVQLQVQVLQLLQLPQLCWQLPNRSLPSLPPNCVPRFMYCKRLSSGGSQLGSVPLSQLFWRLMYVRARKLERASGKVPDTQQAAAHKQATAPTAQGCSATLETCSLHRFAQLFGILQLKEMTRSGQSGQRCRSVRHPACGCPATDSRTQGLQRLVRILLRELL